MNESPQAISCPLTQLSVFMLFDIHAYLYCNSFTKLAVEDKDEVKRKLVEEAGV